MIISTQTAVLSGEFGDKEAIKIIAEAGFDAFDFSFSDWDLYELKEKEKELLSGDFIGYAKELRKFADDCGIICNQAHAPFPSSRGTDEDEEIFEYITRSMEFAATLGAKVIVVHPKQHIYHLNNVEELFRINVEFYKSLAPYCEKFGIKVALSKLIPIYDELIVRLEAFYDAFEYQWMAENKPQGFEIQNIRLGGLINRAKYCRKAIAGYVSGEREEISELAEKLVKFQGCDAPSYFCYNSWRDIVSAGRLSENRE